LGNKLIKEVKNDLVVDPLNKMDPSQALDAFHFQNFVSAVKEGITLASGIVGGHQSTLLCQLGNIAMRTNAVLEIDSTNGHILNNKATKKFWKRQYEKGWEPTI